MSINASPPQLPAGVNSSAIYVFLLLQWLLEAPYTLEELQACYQAHPWCGKRLSDDSIRLYLNTLRALGCKIKRPSAKNKFRYQLLSQSFTVTNGVTLMTVLLKLFGELEASTNLAVILQRYTAINHLMHYSGVDLQPVEALTTLPLMIENAVPLKTLIEYTQQAAHSFISLQVAYRLPAYDKSTHKKAESLQQWTVIPLGLLQEKGRVYWLVWEVVADQTPQWVQRMLRLDRLVRVEPLKLPSTIEAYFQGLTATYFDNLPRYRFKISCPLGVNFSGLGFHQETVSVTQESQRLLRSSLPTTIHYNYSVQTDFTFLLMQRLFAIRGTFTVLEAPKAFQAELQTELQQSLALYSFTEVQEV